MDGERSFERYSSVTQYTFVCNEREQGAKRVILDQKVVVQAASERVWEFVMDIQAVSRCVPGVESFEKIDDDTFLG
ncbi:MAG: SRPBCC domain-containing protein, partial [Candidatus Limnocylindrales bacterium]